MTKTIKLHNEGNWTAVPNKLIEDPALSWKAKGLYAYLTSRPDGWEVREMDLERRSNDGRTSLRAGIRELEEAGWLTRKQEREGGKYTHTSFTLHRSPSTGNPSTEKPTTEKPSTENVPYSKKKESKTESNNTEAREALVREALHWLTIYPERSEPHHQAPSLKAYIAAREAGATEQQLLDAASNYRHWAKKQDKIGSPYIYIVANFLREHWREWVDRKPLPDVIVAADGTRYLR